jgi:hypothetical protein
MALRSWAARDLGDLDRAQSLAVTSLELRRAERDSYGEAECLALLETIERARGGGNLRVMA